MFWLRKHLYIDDFVVFINTNPLCFLLQGPPHKCALFFVDNSGVDIILGVMPFVRELLLRGTEVRH